MFSSFSFCASLCKVSTVYFCPSIKSLYPVSLTSSLFCMAAPLIGSSCLMLTSVCIGKCSLIKTFSTLFARRSLFLQTSCLSRYETNFTMTGLGPGPLCSKRWILSICILYRVKLIVSSTIPSLCSRSPVSSLVVQGIPKKIRCFCLVSFSVHQFNFQ